MRILLTGAAGRLGRVVCRQLASQGDEVVAVDGRYLAGLPVPLHVVSLLDRMAVYPLIEGCQAVVHLANHPDMQRNHAPQTIYSENVTTDANVFQAAMDVGVRQIVYSSSVQVFGGIRCGPEDLARPSCLAYLPADGALPTAHNNLYALGKQAGENMLQFHAALDPQRSYTAIRLPWLMRGVETVRYPGQTVAQLGRLDELFAYLGLEDAASFTRAVLAANRPGYACCLPASPSNLIGWPVTEIVRTVYPQVPLRRPLHEITSLVDLDTLRADYGWEASQILDLPRLPIRGLAGS